MHTGCLSAGPQRFVIGSNGFRSLTCFEVPLRLPLYPPRRSGVQPSRRAVGMTKMAIPASIFWVAEAGILRFFLSLALIFAVASVSVQKGLAQSQSTKPSSLDPQSLPQNPQAAQSGTSGLVSAPQQSGAKPGDQKPEDQATPPSQQQPKRILGVMPNYRAVSAGAIPPPPTPKEAFRIATQNTFDYSSFIFVGLTSAIAEGTDAHPQLGKGMPGFGRYYWRGFVDKADGNYLVIFALPTVFHQDERYYAMGHGGFWKRFAYSASRVVITPDYEGHNSFNTSELLGRGAAQAISISYYPSKTRTVGAISAKFGYAILRDAATNAFREFWPDIAVHVLHRHP